MKYIQYKTYWYSHKIYVQDIDCFYDSQLIYLFVNRFNFQGGKTLNNRLLYKWLYTTKKMDELAVDSLYKCIFINHFNYKTVPITVYGRPEQMPVPLMDVQAIVHVMCRILKSARAREGINFISRFNDELLAIAFKLSHSVAQEEINTIYANGIAGRIFLHYRWR